MALEMPLYAVVKSKNKSNMAKVLEKAAFASWDPIYKMDDETAWVWLPPGLR